VQDKTTAAAAALSRATTAKVTGGVRKGVDLLRVGNIGDTGVAFFFERRKMPAPNALMQWLEQQVVPVLTEVCEVFNYDQRYVTLFHQHGSASRFVRQRLLLNTAPIWARLGKEMKANKVTDLRQDPEGWAYCYFYGLMIHKLGHFHDIVHGTRHDFMMNELRCEYMERWIELLERRGLDPEAIETSTLTRWMVKQMEPLQTVN
jgi:hypothetical protein